MQGTGEQAFARPRLAEDQDGRQAARPGLAPEQLLDLSPDRREPRALTYQSAQQAHGERILNYWEHYRWIFTTSVSGLLTNAKCSIPRASFVALLLPSHEEGTKAGFHRQGVEQ